MEETLMVGGEDTLLGTTRVEAVGHGTGGTKTTFWQALVNLLKGNIGAGILSLPFAFKLAGYVLSPVLLVCIATICVYCMHTIVSCKKTLVDANILVPRPGGVVTYGDVASAVFGSKGGRLIDFFLCLTQLGICTVYFVFVANNLHSLIDSIPIRVFILILTPPVILMSWIRSWRAISPLSLLATLSVAFGIIVVFYVDFSHYPYFEDKEATNKIGAPLDIPVFFGTAMFVYEGIGVIIPMETQMIVPELFPRVINVTYLLFGLLTIAFGFFGYLAFEEETEGTISLNLSDGTFVEYAVKISLSLSLFLTFPIQYYPAFEVVEVPALSALSLPSQPIPGFTGWDWRLALSRAAFRTTLVIATASVGFAFPDKIGILIGLVGASGQSVLALIAPPIIYLKVHADSPTPLPLWLKLFNGFIALLGIFGALMGTILALQELIKNDSPDGGSAH